jgi:hypothetical protein
MTLSYELGTKNVNFLTNRNLSWYMVSKKTYVFIKKFLVEQALFVGFLVISNNIISSRNKYIFSHITYYILDPRFIAMQFLIQVAAHLMVSIALRSISSQSKRYLTLFNTLLMQVDSRIPVKGNFVGE